MIERRYTFAGIPLLTLAEASGSRPAVLFYHGLHSSKETHRKELESLAARGFLAVGVDAVGHGERAIADLSQFLNRGELLPQVAKLLGPSVAEVPLLVDHFSSDSYGPVGLAGISFGGMIAFGAAARESRLRAVVAILGDPTWYQTQLKAFANTPLFAWNGGRDQHVDPKGARELIAALKREYPTGDFAYREYPRSDHFMEPDDWNDGWRATLDWLDRYLRRKLAIHVAQNKNGPRLHAGRSNLLSETTR
ncbi:MAG TPA: alpha/beta fold hydrolase [Chthoniobacterales bacterium]